MLTGGCKRRRPTPIVASGVAENGIKSPRLGLYRSYRHIVENPVKQLLSLIAFCFLTLPLLAQDPSAMLSSLPQAKDYVQKRISSYDRTGGNADARSIAPGETLTLLDEAGPGLISHVWVTIASDDPNHLKALVLRMYWDGEATAERRDSHWRLLRVGTGRLSPVPVAAVVCGCGQGVE